MPSPRLAVYELTVAAPCYYKMIFRRPYCFPCQLPGILEHLQLAAGTMLPNVGLTWVYGTNFILICRLPATAKSPAVPPSFHKEVGVYRPPHTLRELVSTKS